ncbi:Cysteine and histidine-rich protein 1 -like protein [Halotydeus destructor]|nr:Cysteine and histidine-rich protein 1 -like protein [Halotydeus destructor]
MDATSVTLTLSEPSTSNFVSQSLVSSFGSNSTISSSSSGLLSENQGSIDLTMDEPSKKKLKLASGLGLQETPQGPKCPDKLEQRLGGILCCAVCLDLPISAVYQCTNGHLMCSGCFAHLLADARLKDETATCPNCRCVLTKELCSRNLAVEKAVSELPGLCKYCSKELPRAMLNNHEVDICEERLNRCGFSRIGCPWRGPFHELANHEEGCSHPKRSGREVIVALELLDKHAKEERKLYDCIFDLLSFEKITFNDLQLKPYRTDEFIHRLYYETSRFTAFNNQWVVKSRINDDQKDPTLSCDRKISYQLVLKTKITSPFAVHYLILNGPFGDMKLNPQINKHEFSETNTESPYTGLPLIDTAECNKIVAAKAINFRLIMFQAPK